VRANPLYSGSELFCRKHTNGWRHASLRDGPSARLALRRDHTDAPIGVSNSGGRGRGLVTTAREDVHGVMEANGPRAEAGLLYQAMQRRSRPWRDDWPAV
jgi:hypothetical protein